MIVRDKPGLTLTNRKGVIIVTIRQQNWDEGDFSGINATKDETVFGEHGFSGCVPIESRLARFAARGRVTTK
jgi:hypothetical protein